jgi:DNA-binding HxlR family transcriptional regulator
VYLDAFIKNLYEKRKIKTSFNAFKKKLQRIIKNKLNDILKLIKKDGILFIDFTIKAKHTLINLIKLRQNSNYNIERAVSKFAGEYGGNTKILKNKANLHLIKNKMLEYDNIKEINELFMYYLQQIDNKYIVLKRTGADGFKEKDFLKISYKTRFNSGSRIYQHIEKIDDIFYMASKKYKNAVFLTLTTDPKKFNNLQHSYKAFSQNLNKFFSYLRKKFKKRLPYINVFEFTESGLLHCHIVIFGVKYLLNSKKISYLWNKYGQGKIIKIYALKSDDGGFTWLKNKPADCKEKSLSNYLTKYLRKAFYDKEALSLYWASNKRFYTYSRVLYKNEKDIKPKFKKWEYVGVFHKIDIEKAGGVSELYIKILDKLFNSMRGGWSWAVS